MLKNLSAVLFISGFVSCAMAEPFTLQIGAYSQYSDAEVVAERLREHASPVTIRSEAASKGKILFKVLAGDFSNRSEATSEKEKLNKIGFRSFVRSNQTINSNELVTLLKSE